MAFLQVVLVIIVLALELGPLGRQGTETSIPSLTIITTWAFTWFADQKTGLRWAVLAGLLLDLTGFMPFGSWLAATVLSCLLTDFLKTRFFEVSSIPLALLALAIVSLLSSLLLSLLAGSFDIFVIAGGVLMNVIGGLIVYYGLAFRFRFFQRWTGRRL